MGYDLHLDSSLYIYSHARAFSLHPDFDLLAAVEPDEQKQKVFIQTYKSPVYSDLDTALSQHQPDVVVIAVSTQLHAEILYAVLNKCKPKAILCEKPLSYDSDNARTMIEICQTKRVDLYVNYMRRSDPGVINIRKLIDSKDFQSPIKGVAWYSKGFIHNGSHLFNLLEYWLGAMKSFNLLGEVCLQDEDPEPDVRVEFEKGTIVFLAAWEKAFSHYEIELLSMSGRIRYEQGGALIQWQSVQDDSVFKGCKVLASQSKEISSEMSRSQWNVVHQLNKAMEGEESHLCTGSEALVTLEYMNLILK